MMYKLICNSEQKHAKEKRKKRNVLDVMMNNIYSHGVFISVFLNRSDLIMYKDKASSVINWSYSGSTDLSFGTGATNAEQVLGFFGGFIGVALYIFFFIRGTYLWNYWQYALAALLGFDVAGGLVCNCLNSCKRFYSSPLQPTETSTITRFLKKHWIFTLIHIHSIVIQLYFGSTHTRYYGLFWYFALQLSASIVSNTPLYLQRPIAMLICLLSLLLNYYIIPTINGFEWFIPALFIKIIYGHLVQEEPYRPVTEQCTKAQ